MESGHIINGVKDSEVAAHAEVPGGAGFASLAVKVETPRQSERAER